MDNVIKEQSTDYQGIRLSIRDGNDREIGRTYLYFIHNDLHNRPLGFIEDVYVRDDMRNIGCGTKLMRYAIQLAKKHNSYKLIVCSRFENQRALNWYEKLGFRKHGYELRMDFTSLKKE